MRIPTHLRLELGVRKEPAMRRESIFYIYIYVYVDYIKVWSFHVERIVHIYIYIVIHGSELDFSNSEFIGHRFFFFFRVRYLRSLYVLMGHLIFDNSRETHDTSNEILSPILYHAIVPKSNRRTGTSTDVCVFFFSTYTLLLKFRYKTIVITSMR